MSLTAEHKQQLREAIGLARNGAPRDLDDALRILNEQLIDGTYAYSLIGAEVLNETERRAHTYYAGAYTEAFAALRTELAYAPPIGGGEIFTPEPEEHEESYPTPAPTTPPVITTDEAASLQAQINVLKGVVTALLANGGGVQGGALAGVVPFTPSNGDIGFQFNTGTVTHRLYGNPEDYGLRLWFNYREPYVAGVSHSLPWLPQQALFFEQDGAASFIYGKPKTTATGPYDGLKGKDLAIRGGGWRDDGQREKFVSIYTGNVGRGLQLGVCRTNPNYPDRFDFKIDPDGGDNPISITVGGQLRRVRVRDDGSLYVE